MRSSAAFIGGGVTAAFIAACGLAIEGEGSTASPPPGPEGGVVSATDGASSADVEGKEGAAVAVVDGSSDANDGAAVLPTTFCGQQRQQDPLVVRCLDFEQDIGAFGFEGIRQVGGAFTREPSPFPSSGVGLTATVNDVSGSRDAIGAVFPVSKDVYAATEKVTLDLDVMIASMTVSYAIVADFQVVGPPPCGHSVGVGVFPSGTIRWTDGEGNTVSTYTPGVPFHLQLAVRPVRGASSTTDVTINGRNVSRLTAYDSGCDVVRARIGAFYSGDEPGTMVVKMDNFVVRRQPK